MDFHGGPVVKNLHIYLQKNMMLKDTCTPVFTVALFKISKAQKQPKCLTEEWIKKISRNEKALQWEAQALKLERCPGLLQLDKAHAQQWRPSADKNNFFFKVKSLSSNYFENV